MYACISAGIGRAVMNMNEGLAQGEFGGRDGQHTDRFQPYVSEEEEQ